MELRSLGFAVFGAPDLDEWVRYGTNLLGLQLADKSDRQLCFRMDERAGRIWIDATRPADYRCFGWEVDSAADLGRLADRLGKAGVAVRAADAAERTERGAQDMIFFQDPMGNRHAAYHGAVMAASPFVPGRAVSGFRTGALGIGHVLLTTESMAKALPFFTDIMGMQVSDYMEQPFYAYFLHVNGRHHSVGLIETGQNGMHHLMMELMALDDVGQGYDIAQLDPDLVKQTLGRHANDLMLSFYTRSPSGFLVEYGWGGRLIDPATWTVEKCELGASLWGHERHWLPPDARKRALELRLEMGARGIRAPVQVLPGNYRLMETDIENDPRTARAGSVR